MQADIRDLDLGLPDALAAAGDRPAALAGPAAGTTQSCDTNFPSAPLFSAASPSFPVVTADTKYATRAPSGEIRGDSEIEP